MLNDRKHIKSNCKSIDGNDGKCNSSHSQISVSALIDLQAPPHPPSPLRPPSTLPPLIKLSPANIISHFLDHHQYMSSILQRSLVNQFVSWGKDYCSSPLSNHHDRQKSTTHEFSAAEESSQLLLSCPRLHRFPLSCYLDQSAH